MIKLFKISGAALALTLGALAWALGFLAISLHFRDIGGVLYLGGWLVCFVVIARKLL